MALKARLWLGIPAEDLLDAIDGQRFCFAEPAA